MAYFNSRPGSIKDAATLPVQPYHRDTPLAEYDLNFEFPVKVLASNGVRVEPLVPSLHAAALWSLVTEQGEETYRYFRRHMPDSYDGFLTHLESVRRQPTAVHFVLFDKSFASEKEGKGRVAGWLKYHRANPADKSVEVGLTAFPQFQRTHVTTHGVGLLLQYALDTPQEGGLGLRRVQWTAHYLNVASQQAALRLGVTHEGTLRYEQRIDPSKEGQAMPCPYEQDDHPAKHMWYGSVTCEDWHVHGKREHVANLMARTVVMKES